LISGEHPTLPVSELKAILESEGYSYQITEQLTQVLLLEADANCVDVIEFRSALTRKCCEEVFNCKAERNKILDSVTAESISQFIGAGESFVVRVRKVKGVVPELVSVDLERELGEKIFETVKGSRVDLTKPQKTFFGVVTDDRFVFGLKTAEIIPKPFSERRPRKRPFFHPSSMQAKSARAMVNLAQPRKGELVLDPFCGSSGMLVEAGLIGCRVAGFDAKPHMLKGGLKNLRHFGIDFEGLAIADARYPPVSKVDCIVTDPPYGRSASTLGTVTLNIVEDFLSVVGDILPRGARICMAAPKTINLGQVGEKMGFKHMESHFVYVHRSLTREIVVFKKE
jgi:tRNA (guanine10-N2)-dimethyltransferase